MFLLALYSSNLIYSILQKCIDPLSQSVFLVLDKGHIRQITDKCLFPNWEVGPSTCDPAHCPIKSPYLTGLSFFLLLLSVHSFSSSPSSLLSISISDHSLTLPSSHQHSSLLTSPLLITYFHSGSHHWTFSSLLWSSSHNQNTCSFLLSLKSSRVLHWTPTNSVPWHPRKICSW